MSDVEQRREFSAIRRYLLSATELCREFDMGEISKMAFLNLDRQFLAPAFSGDSQHLVESSPLHPTRFLKRPKVPLFRRQGLPIWVQGFSSK